MAALTPAAKEDAPEVNVSFEDQQLINEFGRLNNKLHDVQDDLKTLQEKVEHFDDATTELMMSEGSVRLKLGEGFIDCSEDYATEYCEKHQARLQEQNETLQAEETRILERQ